MNWEEYKKQRANQTNITNNGEWMPTVAKCPKCGQPVYRNTRYVLASYPAQYTYKCLSCGWLTTWF